MIRTDSPLRPLVFAVLLVAASGVASGQKVPTPGSYESSRFIFVDPPWMGASDGAFDALAAKILGTMPGGAYARPGLVAFIDLDMPWFYDAAAPALTSPNASFLSTQIPRAQARGLSVHFQTIAGISRTTGLYDTARLEDRRNCQWYSLDNLLKDPNPARANDVWLTPSRYARKLRRHLETKTRLWGSMLVSLRQQFPNTLQSASGDGEMELNSGRGDDSVPYRQQIIADYSPFAILEFRDWIQNTGLYAPGQLYAGQGFAPGGTWYQGPEGLALFNATYGTAFSSWDLKYFNWSLSDPADGDPRAIPSSVYDAPGWKPMPTSGPDFIVGGFDAPRSWDILTPDFWQLWQTFRVAMVNHYVRDFSSWITTTTDPSGSFLEPSRWYSHQIPADYLFGQNPASPTPFARLNTSASPMKTALVNPTGSLGLTSFDLYLGLQNPPMYLRTSQYLFPDLQALNLPNWGLMEYSPSWGENKDPVSGAPLCDPDVAGISTQVDRAFSAGAHVLVLNNWPLCTDTTLVAFGLSLDRQKNSPGTWTPWWTPPPPAPQEVQGTWFSTTISLSWSNRVFTTPAPTWATWGYFSRFEVWRGASPGFTTTDGHLVLTSVIPSVTGIQADASRPFYRILAVNTAGQRGALSAAVSPAAPAGSGFFTLLPCRLLDTRVSTTPETLGGPVLSPGEARIFEVAARCGIPPASRSLSVNLTVDHPSAPGFLTLFPGDAAPPVTSNINFSAGQVRANNGVLPLSADGKFGAMNGSSGSTNLVIDVNGYFK